MRSSRSGEENAQGGGGTSGAEWHSSTDVIVRNFEMQLGAVPYSGTCSDDCVKEPAAGTTRGLLDAADAAKVDPLSASLRDSPRGRDVSDVLVVNEADDDVARSERSIALSGGDGCLVGDATMGGGGRPATGGLGRGLCGGRGGGTVRTAGGGWTPSCTRELF